VEGEVAQIMYTHVSKYKNDKIKKVEKIEILKVLEKIDSYLNLHFFFMSIPNFGG
jgi:hypothetical protein